MAAAALWRLLPAQADGPVDPAVVREDVERVMSQRRFSYEPSLVQRFLRWLGEQLPDVEGQGGSFGGGAPAWVAWLIILLTVAAALVVGVLLVRSRRRSGKADAEPVSETEVEHHRRAADWRSEAERFEAEGAWKEALRARYRELVRTLVDRHQLPDVPGRTTGELRGDLAATTPDAADAFDTACLCFELAWYADLPTGEAQVRSVRSAATSVIAAPVADRYLGASLRSRVGGGSAPVGAGR